MNRSPRSLFATSLIVAVVAFAGGCQSAPRPATVVQLKTLNDSGVTGTVTLTDLGDGRTTVDVAVQPAGNLDMPAQSQLTDQQITDDLNRLKKLMESGDAPVGGDSTPNRVSNVM